jgi:hypothetical protein
MFFRIHSARSLEYIVLWDTERTGHYLLVCPLQKNLGLVEAKNFVPYFVPYIWAPGAEGASGATGYARDHCDP